ncbi:MAG: phosphoribosylanthranilate isomerase [Chloroflexota bacterium]
MTAVKICGLSSVEDAVFASQTGAALLGFVFAPSRRQVGPQQARSIIATVREQSHPGMVGVFVNLPAAEVNRIADQCRLDYVQLSGEEPEAVIQAIELPVIKTIHVGEGMTRAAIQDRLDRTPASIIHFDTAIAGRHGGTGQVFDWSLLPTCPVPVLLAGGLDPMNVEAAIRAVRPWGVDVSSGVETNGTKDSRKIQQFIQRAAAPPDS